MIENIKVAVIMSVYKSDDACFFKEAVSSMLRQSVHCDIFIHKDGPVSNELNVALNSFHLLDNVFISGTTDNCGLAKSLNYMIDLTLSKKYKYIARMDSDDVSHVSRIEKQVEFLEHNESIDVLGTSCHEFGASFALAAKHLPTTHEQLVDFSISRCPFIHPSVIFRSTVFSSGVRYPSDSPFTEDMALWFILLENGFRFANLNDVLLDYRLSEDTISRRLGLKKAMAESVLRYSYMRKTDNLSLRNYLSIFMRFCFHLLPSPIVSYLYRYLR
jgi:glycosyltransferase involved in cell wall biosynthesis